MKAKNTVKTSALRDPERIEEANNEISHELIEEKIKVNLGPLNEQASTLTQLIKSIDPRKLYT